MLRLLRKGRCIGGPLTTAWLEVLPSLPLKAFHGFTSARMAFEGHVGCGLLG